MPGRLGGARSATPKDHRSGTGCQHGGQDPNSPGRQDRPRALNRLVGSRGRTPQILEARHYRPRLRLCRQGSSVFLV